MAISVKSFPSGTVKSYSAERSNIRSGDILLCSGSALFSKMIQKATKSVWSHVGFVIRLDSIGRVMVLESVESIGVRTVPLRSYVENYNGSGKGYPGKLLIARHDGFTPNTDVTKLAKFAVDLFGYPYDKDEILRIAARIGMGWLGLSKKDVKRDNEYICSEYAWECFRSVGIKVPYNKKGFIAPADFAQAKAVKKVAVIKR